ncbi:MAG TPA: polyphosphate polymerase domain-containing protein [Bacteroidota bacterium]|nr:polyphosphate polymerase domain-containing protein [Bacteroidota bacterium]
MYKNIFQRREDKYLIHQGIVLNILNAIHQNFSYTSRQHYNIASTYFDNSEWMCYLNHISKVEPRYKLRFRQYGDHEGFFKKGFLEIKEKDALYTYKRRFRIHEDWIEDLSNENVIEGILDLNAASVSSSFPHTYQVIKHKIESDSLAPILRVEYDRISFEKSNPFLRITFDSKMKYQKYHERGQDSVSFNNEFMIMEVKTIEEKPEWLIELFRRYSIRKKSFSKYAFGVSLLYTPLFEAAPELNEEPLKQEEVRYE